MNISSTVGDELVCGDCGREFLWTAGEQAYYFAHGLSQPKRCRECRELRRLQRVESSD